VLIPLLLICTAAGAAAIVAYGTSPVLAEYAHGVAIITLSRRLEWPMVAISLALCAVLLALTISGRRGIWWLLGLGPILALFIRAFSTAYHPAIALLDSPRFVAAYETNSIPNEYTVGLIFDGKPYAFPYPALTDDPLILLTAFDKRVLIIWSVTANCAVALPLDRDTNAREIEVVSRPADSLLLYDSRLGQFIVGVTGRTIKGEVPIGFGPPITVAKMPLADWVALHPDSQVVASSSVVSSSATVPVLPLLRFKVPTAGPPAGTRIAILSITPPTAILADQPLEHPLNVDAGDIPVLLERDPRTRMLRAYDRHLKGDLFLTFKPIARPPRKHPEAAMIDSDSQSLWTLDGKAIDGPLKGEHLHEIALDDGLYWGVMKFWMPQLQLIESK
jgi:hypothetical protein